MKIITYTNILLFITILSSCNADKGIMNEAEVQENKSTLESSETKKVPEVQVEKTIEVAEDILLPETIASGIFSKVKVATSGGVKFVKEGDVYQIQISNLKTGSAPDLGIYLSKQNEINSSQDISSSLKLANLKSKNGDQIYVVPSDIDLNEYKSIAIHCTQYNKLFGSASMR